MVVSSTVLPAPNISISFSGDFSAGLENSINCSASVVDGLVVLPDLMIEFHSIVIFEKNNSSLVYIFSPLRTSDRGQYTCTATINIPQAGITDLQTSTTEAITVASQSSFIDPINEISYYPFSTVPTPTVMFSGQLVYPVNLSLSTTLYSGTVFTLTCVVELVPEVDTAVTVLTSWNKDGRNITNTSRIAVNSVAVKINITTSAVIYESDILFNPLSNMESGGDDGNYTCSVQVKDQEFIYGSHTIATQNISVEGQ